MSSTPKRPEVPETKYEQIVENHRQKCQKFEQFETRKKVITFDTRHKKVRTNRSETINWGGKKARGKRTESENRSKMGKKKSTK